MFFDRLIIKFNAYMHVYFFFFLYIDSGARGPGVIGNCSDTDENKRGKKC